ncbi:MAG: 2OG-Fe(II) oxygenase, partial [Burkholderiaceae bacterium]
MNDFVEVYDDALSIEFCERLIGLFEQSPHQQAGR